jgi:5-methylcytosine-specific restriction endonuclease McrA
MSLMSSCLVCGKVIQLHTSRCQAHQRRRSSRSSQPERTNNERLRRKAAVDDWRSVHGEVCPGFGVTGHLVVSPNRLTADHVRPISLGGDVDGELQVLCLGCNVRKGGANRLRFPSRRSR